MDKYAARLWVLVVFATVRAMGQQGDASVASRVIALGRAKDTALRFAGGFSSETGSFARASASSTDRLGLGETIDASALYGVRLRQAEFGVRKPFLDRRLEVGAGVYGRRFQYDQGRDASILAFSRDVPEAQAFGADLLRYVSHGYGMKASVVLRLRSAFSRVGLTYNFDVTGVRPMTQATNDYFSELHFVSTSNANRLSGIRTSRITATYAYNTVNDPLRPTAGAMFSASLAVAGLGGDVNTIEPTLEGRWFHAGFWRGHVIATRVRGRMLAGFNGRAAPPFDRYDMGGEQDVRGFASWSLSPAAYVPGTRTIPVISDDGIQRTQKVVQADGSITAVPVTMSIPAYRAVAGGRRHAPRRQRGVPDPAVGASHSGNLHGCGCDRTSLAGQLKWNEGVLHDLAAAQGVEFAGSPLFQGGSQRPRASSGVELQLVTPKIHAPVRISWAYNWLRCSELSTAVAVADTPACNALSAPFVAGRNEFPNYATFANALAQSGAPSFYRDPRFLVRFAIGFSF
jgi:outer membrane protein insertion porin family